MAYKKLLVKNTEYNRRHKLTDEGMLVYILLEKNGIKYFAAERTKNDRQFFACPDEIFEKHFQITEEEHFAIIENLQQLKYNQYP